jgi:hypothetical protein
VNRESAVTREPAEEEESTEFEKQAVPAESAVKRERAEIGESTGVDERGAV